MLRTAIAVWFALLVSSNSFAMELTIDSYEKAIRKGEDEKAVVTVWLDGLHRGLTWANIANIDENNRDRLKFFCPPGKFAMTVEQVQSILDRYIETHHIGGSKPVGLILLFALKELFPCP
jgi:hypothetical protein